MLRPQLEQVAHGLEDELCPSAVATQTLSDVTRLQRNLMVSVNKFYSNTPSVTSQSNAILKLFPLMPIQPNEFKFDKIIETLSHIPQTMSF